MINRIKIKFLKSKFKRKFVGFNQYTAKAFTLKTDEDFKKLCWNCINEIAGENKKDIRSVSLEDIYRVLDKIRKKTSKLLRKTTLYQVIKLKNIGSSTMDAFNVIYSISGLTVVPLIYVGLKNFLERKLNMPLRFILSV